MELARKNRRSYFVPVCQYQLLETDKKYPIVLAKPTTSKFGPTVLLTICDSESTTVQTFLPKRYSAVVSEDDIENINNKVVSLNLTYMGICEKSRSYLLKIEK